jgi:hypothetical protein
MLLKSFKNYHSSWKLPDVDQLLDTFLFKRRLTSLTHLAIDVVQTWQLSGRRIVAKHVAAKMQPTFCQKSSYYTFTLSAPQKGARSPVLGKKEAVRVSVEACWVL